MRVYLDTLGCRLNQAELGCWQDELRAHGHTPASDPDDADLLILNTCAVTREAARKSRQLIRRIRRRNPRGRLVISGCYSTLEREEAAAIAGVDLIVANRDKEQLVARALQGLPATTTTAPAPVRRRAFVKVQDGCRHRCTFCIVTVARGAERSRPPADIIEQIRQLEKQGVQEIVLSGVHLGGYESEGPLDALLGRILSDTDVPRLRLGSLEPWTLSDRLLARFSNQRLLPHLHLPLQSGCDRTLKRMARRYRRADFARLLADIRSQHPNCNISTDIIVGFPGESEADWQNSLAFIEEMQFAHCHVFSYSARPGSAAAQFAGQVPEQEKKDRNRAARRLSARMHEAFLHRQIGRHSTVLWESRDVAGHWQGHTENYLRAVLPHGQAPSAAISKVRLVSLQATGALLTREAQAASRSPARQASRTL